LGKQNRHLDFPILSVGVKPSADLTSGLRISVLGIWIGSGPGILGFEELAWAEEEDDASERGSDFGKDKRKD
jgi:hypothetical protein